MAINFFSVIVWIVITVCPLTSFGVTIGEYIPVLGNEEEPRETLVSKYFNLGFPYEEILAFLSKFHGIVLSLRQLKRLLRNMGLRRRKESTPMMEVATQIERELKGSASSLGYRAMHHKLCTDHGHVVSRETVRQLLKIIDPEGVDSRLRHRLKRRHYKVKGPNYLWHIDGYDKLKPFGFCIHGAIDGYSRRVLWLEVGPSNNNPRIIAQYFLDYVRQIHGAPRIVRADCGTENIHVAAMQRFFRSQSDDSFAGDKSFMYGKSTSNQRIEAWWSQLRRCHANWWINYFKDLRDAGIYNDADFFHEECLKFCFMKIIQGELYQVVKNWNTHCIRPSQNMESPAGRPDVSYFLPEVNATRDYATRVNEGDLRIAEEMCCQLNPENGCDVQFNELAIILMEENGLTMPTSCDEAQIIH